ncbi:MAG: CoA pyrophosphatase [Glaciecola sp.]|nr:CoA pyrophosphatase [Glaciecola sp.]MDG2100647.1 CoA pyrophosphatase [Glaciecola sp.]
MDRHTFITAFNHCRLVENEHDFPSLHENFASPRDAAVMILLVERANGLHVMFTRRAEHLKHHAGQISFPGGKYETFDASLQHTAIRETEEEIGISIGHNQVLGSIGQYATISGFHVTPYIAIADSIPPLVIDKNEVAYAFEVPLAHCINPQNILSHHITRFDKTFPVYFIPWQDTYIWGATAGMLKHLSNHLLSKVN